MFGPGNEFDLLLELMESVLCGKRSEDKIEDFAHKNIKARAAGGAARTLFAKLSIELARFAGS